MATASLQAHKTFFFNVDPNNITWTYQLNTKTIETYGGKVVQIVSINWDNLSVDFDSGSKGPNGGGREYLRAVGNFFKDAVIWQKNTGQTSVFSYPPRNYVISCFLDSVSIQDDLKNVTFPFSFQGKIQRDLMGTIKKETYSSVISRLVDGVGWTKNEFTYNTAVGGVNSGLGDTSIAHAGTIGATK